MEPRIVSYCPRCRNPVYKHVLQPDAQAGNIVVRFECPCDFMAKNDTVVN